MDSDAESQTSEESTHCEDDVEQATEEERTSIRDKVSSMSFEELLELKNKLGSKQYNQTVHGVSKKKPRIDFKRANKNRPREVSSKIRMKLNKRAPVKKVMSRDPRFDPLCGSYDEKIFKTNYKFIKDIKKSEKEQLEKEYIECEDPHRKQQIQLVMQRLDNQIREQEKLEEKRNQLKEERQTIKEKLKIGEKPEYKKKSTKTIENLINRYEELKKNNKLQKHIEKKNRQLNKKDVRQRNKF